MFSIDSGAIGLLRGLGIALQNNLQQLGIETVPPSAASFIESLRDIGYSLKHALADIVDNSISAKASVINIVTEMKTDGITLSIADNGCGMDRAELIRAMQLGSRNPLSVRDKYDLGRFGLGLKTASFSQCRRLEVYTRKGGISNAAIWDLNHVAQTNRWEVLIPADSDISTELRVLSGDGTLVHWKLMDRIGTAPFSKKDFRDVTELLLEVKRHLEIVFHRFIQGDRDRASISINMNGRPLEAFDPFWADHALTKATPFEPEIIPYRDGSVSIQAFTLPHHSNISKTDWEAHAGPGGYVSNQGFYLYRAKRLLVWGTWFGLDRRRAVNQLCRVQIDVDNSYDADWQVDIKKSRANPPRVIRDRLEALMDRLTTDTRRIYKRRGQQLVNATALPFWERHHDDDGYRYKPDSTHPVISAYRDNLTDEMARRFDSILEMLGASLPFATIFSDLGDDPQSIISTMQDETALDAARAFYKALLGKDISHESALAAMRASKLFENNWKLIQNDLNIYRNRIEGIDDSS